MEACLIQPTSIAHLLFACFHLTIESVSFSHPTVRRILISSLHPVFGQIRLRPIAIRNRPKCSRHGHVAAWRAELVTRGAISASRARAVHGPRVQAAYDDYAVPPAYPPSADALRMELILTPSDRLILIAAPPALIPPSLTLSCRLLLHPALWLIWLILIAPLFSRS